MIVSSGRTTGIVLVAVCLVACDGAPSAAAPVIQPEEMQQGAVAAPATAQAAAPANALAPSWLKLQGKAGPVKGRYACQDWEGYSIARVQANANYGGDVRRSTYFTSEFSITGEGTYVYHGSQPKTGRFTYTPATGEVSWKEGPYASEPGEKSTITGIYGMRASDGVPTVVQIFRDPAYGEAAELCFRYKD